MRCDRTAPIAKPLASFDNRKGFLEDVFVSPLNEVLHSESNNVFIEKSVERFGDF